MRSVTMRRGYPFMGENAVAKCELIESLTIECSGTDDARFPKQLKECVNLQVLRFSCTRLFYLDFHRLPPSLTLLDLRGCINLELHEGALENIAVCPNLHTLQLEANTAMYDSRFINGCLRSRVGCQQRSELCVIHDIQPTTIKVAALNAVVRFY